MRGIVETYQRPLRAGMIGGIVAGFVFGLLMQLMGMIPMIASMMGSESLVVGWIIHMIISVIFGIGFGVVAKKRNSYYKLAVIYGVLLWIIGPLVIMPMMMGMGTNLAQAFAPDQLMSLMTHIFFAFILAVVYKKTI